MEKIMEEGKVVAGQPQQQRASVPAFGEWDEMKAAGVLPDYSLDFSKIRAVRMQQRKEQLLPSVWSSAGSAQEVALAAAGDEMHHHHMRQPPASDDRRRHHHRRQHSDGTDLRRPLRAPDRAAATTPKGRSKVKGYLFGCMSGW